jgi:hypothetical protein
VKLCDLTGHLKADQSDEFKRIQEGLFRSPCRRVVLSNWARFKRVSEELTEVPYGHKRLSPSPST